MNIKHFNTSTKEDIENALNFLMENAKEFICTPSPINLDPTDAKATLSVGKESFLLVEEGDTVSEIMKSIFTQDFNGKQANEARAMMFKITFYNSENFLTDEIAELESAVSNLPEDTDIIWGVGNHTESDVKRRIHLLISF